MCGCVEAPGVCSSWTIYGTLWCTSNHIVCLSEISRYLCCTVVRAPCTAKCIGEWQEARIVQIDFSAALDRVNQQGILNKLCLVGVGGSGLSILTQFLSNRSHHVMVNGCRSKLVNVVSVVPQCSWLVSLLFLLYSSEIFCILDKKLIGYADISTLMTIVPSPGIRVTLAESLIRDLGRVSEWCDLWGMKLMRVRPRQW